MSCGITTVGFCPFTTPNKANLSVWPIRPAPVVVGAIQAIYPKSHFIRSNGWMNELPQLIFHITIKYYERHDLHINCAWICDCITYTRVYMPFVLHWILGSEKTDTALRHLHSAYRLYGFVFMPCEYAMRKSCNTSLCLCKVHDSAHFRNRLCAWVNEHALAHVNIRLDRAYGNHCVRISHRLFA